MGTVRAGRRRGRKKSSDVDIAIESKSGVKIDSALEYKVNEFREALENSDIIYIVDVVYMGMAAESLRRSITIVHTFCH